MIVISFALRQQISYSHCYRDLKNILDHLDASFYVENYKFILDELLKLLPKSNKIGITYSNWSCINAYKENAERLCVVLIRNATVAMAKKAHDCFFDYYNEYQGKGYHVFNEIILNGLLYLSADYSDRIIQYIGSNLDTNIFDNTSGSLDKLGITKSVLKKHCTLCSDEELEILENTICSYISPNAFKSYERRVKHNKEHKESPVYDSFWGDLQFELLSSFPIDRLKEETKSLLKVLERKFNHNHTVYIDYGVKAGYVTSPVSGKCIGAKQWLRIITNKKTESNIRFRKDDCF